MLFSGGKDSVMSLYHALSDGHDVAYILSMVSKRDDSYMYHVPNIHMTKLSSESLGIPLLQWDTSGVEEKELDDLREALLFLKNEGVEGIYSGALFSTYQRSRIDSICDDLGLKSVSPLWHVDPLEYMLEILELGFKVIISGVFAAGLDESWLGRVIDKEALDELIVIADKYRINLAFEGGEAETFVLDGPIFKKSISILESHNEWDCDSGVFIIDNAVLADK